jgi:hypothetical protein
MSRMQVASFNDVKIYNLSAGECWVWGPSGPFHLVALRRHFTRTGKSVPQWLTERQRRNLAKDEDYRRRVELLQDFEFPTASQRVRMSPDGQFVVVTGTYPPGVKVYEVQELSMKFERRLTAEVGRLSRVCHHEIKGSPSGPFPCRSSIL